MLEFNGNNMTLTRGDTIYIDTVVLTPLGLVYEIQEGDILRAKDTTLGGDDGIGVAYLLLLLDDKEIEHPDIECLFTTQEEIGMYGARDFNYSDIKAHYLINIDGEEEDTAIVGCAGGVSVNYLKNITALRDINTQVYKLSISGLFGGHSGVDIQKGRINSNLT